MTEPLTKTQRERARAANKAWRLRNIDTQRARERAKRAAIRAQDPEASREADRRWYESNKQRKLDWVKAWQQANKPKKQLYTQTRRARQKGATVQPFDTTQLAAVLEMFTCDDVVYCAYCAAAATDLDHVVPLSRGGAHAPDNVVPACHSCNCSKGAKLLLWQWIGKGIKSYDATKQVTK